MPVLLLALAPALTAQGVPLPPVPVPAENPITEAKRVLGKILFWEEQLSSDNTVACGTCHRTEAGGADPRTALHPGPDGAIGGADDIAGSASLIQANSSHDYAPDPLFGLGFQVTRRRAPDFTAALYQTRVNWDGRSGPGFVDPETGLVAIATGGALEAQAVLPLIAEDEMAHAGRSYGDVNAKLAAARPLALASNLPPDVAAVLAPGTTYPQLFQAAFGTPDVSAKRIAFALATYERTLVPNQSPLDVWQSGQPNPLTPDQNTGFVVFQTVGRCTICHAGATFSDGTFRNLGLRPPVEDPGRQAATGLAGDRGRFKVPALRNVALRTRFFHNGSFSTLDSAVAFYNGGGGAFADNKDILLNGLSFNVTQKNQLVQFLHALTDPRAAAGAFPFDRPTLRSESHPAFSNRYGAGAPAASGVTPAILCNTPAAYGTELKIGLANAPAGAQAWLGISTQPSLPPILASGVPIHVDPATLFLLLPYVLPNPGHATWRIDIPDVAALAGFSFHAQWLLLETPSGAVSATTGATWTIF